MNTVMVRRSRDHDIAAICEIYTQAVNTGTASFELSAPSQTELAERRNKLIEAGYPYFVAELDGRVCGYSYAGPYRPRPAYRNTVENSVYVAPWGQRRGVGKALLTTLIQACVDAGFRQMIAVVGDSQHRASIALHEAVGFRLVGSLQNVGYKHERWLDSVLMQLSLGDGNQTPPSR
ncbi:MAG: GNAT family N-acetyltransferase [Thiotrichales bacterium]|nr:GNAT family N-acetyltransferase [Thiotrichales bacterium]